MTAALYVRVSTGKQVTKTSPASQRRLLIEYCERQGWPYQIYDEGAMSGEHLLDRPVMIQMLNEIRAGKYQVCLAIETTRFSRGVMSEWETIREACVEGNCKIGTPSQIFDIADLDDDFILDVHGIISKRERRLIFQRTQRGLRATAAAGKWTGHRIKYGYCVENNRIVPDESKAPLVRQMCKWILEGNSLERITVMLHNRGIPSPTGNEWWGIGSAYNIVTSETIMGKLNIRGRVLNVTQPVEPIIDADTWFRVRERLKSNNIDSWRNAKHEYLLRGLLVCGLCGHRLVGHINNYRFFYYGCPNRYIPAVRCRFQAVRTEPLETDVWSALTEIMTRPDNVFLAVQHAETRAAVDSLLGEVTLADLDGQMKLKDHERAEILRLFRRGSIDMTDVESQLAEIKADVVKIDKQRAVLLAEQGRAARSVNTLAEFQQKMATVARRLEIMTVPERNSLLKVVVSRIVVDETTARIELALPELLAAPKSNTLSLHLVKGKTRQSVTERSLV